MPNIIEITDFNAQELDVYARLTENQLVSRRHLEQGLFIAESPNVIDRALDAGYRPVSLLMDPKHIEGQAAPIIARCGDIPVFTAREEILRRLTGFTLTRGVLCAMRRRPLPEAEALCRASRRVAVLEDVMNPTNLGAIFRSAAAMGMDAVLLTEGCTDPLYRRCVRVSMGTVFQVPWCYLENSAEEPGGYLAYLKAQGFAAAAMALTEKSLPIDDPRPAREDKLAILLGTEGSGLRPATIAQCDYTLRIPMAHGVDSLNVAAAGAVAFWELRVREKPNA